MSNAPAPPTAATSAAAHRPSRIPWPPLLLLATAITAVLAGRWLPLDWPGVNDAPARVVGLGIGAAGIGLAIWAILTLYRARTTVRPDAGATTLVTWGPYARLRNPIYVADMMLLFGLAELSKNVWFAILALPFAGLVTWLAILPEERHLAARFGAAWDAYRETSRRWI